MFKRSIAKDRAESNPAANHIVFTFLVSVANYNQLTATQIIDNSQVEVLSKRSWMVFGNCTNCLLSLGFRKQARDKGIGSLMEYSRDPNCLERPTTDQHSSNRFFPCLFHVLTNPMFFRSWEFSTTHEAGELGWN